jgi:hypothetical protein
MIARCESCARSFLEIDSRKIADPLPLCSACALDDIERAERERIAEAGKALEVIASAPASWGGALLRMAKR